LGRICSDLRLDLLEVLLQLVHISLLRWPADTQSLLLIGFGDLNRISLSQRYSDVRTLSGPCGSEPRTTLVSTERVGVKSGYWKRT